MKIARVRGLLAAVVWDTRWPPVWPSVLHVLWENPVTVALCRFRVAVLPTLDPLKLNGLEVAGCWVFSLLFWGVALCLCVCWW